MRRLQASAVFFTVLCTIQSAAGSAILRLDLSGVGLTCDNSTAGGVSACSAAGFSTVLGSSSITFSTATVNGVLISGLSASGNAPGSPTLAFVMDTATSVSNLSGAARILTIDVGINNFTLPAGTTVLSGSQTANWTTSSAGDSQSFQTWLRNTNDLVVPGGTGTSITAPCVSPGGLTTSCSQSSPDLAVVATAPFALTSRSVITLAPSTIGTFNGTAALVGSTTPVVPEPSSALLLGVGLVILGSLRRRIR